MSPIPALLDRSLAPRNPLPACLTVVRRVPFSLGIFAAIWVLAALTHSLAHGVSPALNVRWGFAPADLLNGQAYTLITSVLFIHARFMVMPLNLSLLLFVLPYEWYAGTRRVITAFWGAHIIETAISALAVLAFARWGFYPAIRLVYANDVGMSVGTFGCAGALLTVLPRRWRLTGAGALALYLLANLVLHHALYDLDHAIVTPLGFCIAWLLRPVRWRRARAAA